jgi:type II secretory pathway component PulM
LSSGEKYAAAAYAVVLLTVLVWVAIIAMKLVRLEREKAELQELLRQSPPETPPGNG